MVSTETCCTCAIAQVEHETSRLLQAPRRTVVHTSNFSATVLVGVRAQAMAESGSHCWRRNLRLHMTPDRLLIKMGFVRREGAGKPLVLEADLSWWCDGQGVDLGCCRLAGSRDTGPQVPQTLPKRSTLNLTCATLEESKGCSKEANSPQPRLF